MEKAYGLNLQLLICYGKGQVEHTSVFRIFDIAYNVESDNISNRSPDMAAMHQDTSEDYEVVNEKLNEIFEVIIFHIITFCFSFLD